jgi:hypothetical protein
MSNYDMSIHANPDAKAWAEFFMKTKSEQQWSVDDIDEELMVGWFANAMMAMHDHLLNGKALLPESPNKELAWRMIKAGAEAVGMTFDQKGPTPQNFDHAVKSVQAMIAAAQDRSE